MLSTDKTIHLMRHGVTEMNEYLGRTPHPFGTLRFKDPLLYDTRLTARGQSEAARAAARVARLKQRPELLVVSPLTRALQTATIAFGDQPPCPVHVEPLWRERLYLSSDVGRHPEQLQQEYPHLSLDHLPAVWWHTHTPDDPLAIHPEPEDVFSQRMQQLQQWIAARPERCIAVVSHWGVLQALTGQDFENCELQTLRLSELFVSPSPAAAS